jgi:hypothetical protein
MTKIQSETLPRCSSPLSNPITLYIDADACPVKQELYRVAERHARKGVAFKGLPYNVMAGLVPAIHVFAAAWLSRRGWPRHRRAKRRRSSNGHARP